MLPKIPLIPKRIVSGGMVALMLAFSGLIGFSLGTRHTSPAQARSTASGGRPSDPAQGPAGPQSGPGPGSQGSPGTKSGARNALAVRVQELRLGAIETRVLINGDVIPQTQVAVYPTVGGKLTEVRFQVGDRVREGDILAMVDPSRPGEVYAQNPVRAPVSGTILLSPLSPGDTVSTQTVLYQVGELSRLYIETFVPERFSQAAQKGLAAQVSLEALSGETFDALVDAVSPVLDPASRTVKIRLRFTRQDPRIRVGMFAQVNLVTQSRTDVLVVPREAVINTYGSWIAFVVTGEGRAERRELRLGLEGEDALEVLSGLALGEQVVIAGQNFLSDADPVRVVP